MDWARPSVQRELQKTISGRVHLDVSMKAYTSFRIGGYADLMAFPGSKEDLGRLLRKIDAIDLPYVVIGKGTNLLVRDKGIKGLVIKLNAGFQGIETQGPLPDQGAGEDAIFLKVDAATPIRKLLSHCLSRGYGGLEFVVGIPGTFGGAIVQNAGSKLGEIRDVVHSISLMDSEGVISEKQAKALRFSYRHLELPAKTITLGGLLKLQKTEREEIKRQLKEGMGLRRQSQPIGLRSAGCIFKNPPEGPAGMIIEKCGLKGARIGDAQVSFKHANFIVNRGNAAAREVLELIALIQRKVRERMAIELSLEIKVFGE
jgi:UDP-N-acetylmuramate dehydrogenase